MLPSLHNEGGILVSKKNKALVGSIVAKMKKNAESEEENRDTSAMNAVPDEEHEAEMEKRQVKMFDEDSEGKREARAGGWVL